MKKITLQQLILISLFIINCAIAAGQPKSEGNISGLNTSISLDYSGMGITEFPKDIFGMTDLKQLDLSNNKLTSIPDDIQKFKSLTIIKLNGNKIYELPAVVSKLKFLKEIYLDREIWQYRLKEVKKITSARIMLVG